MRQLEHTNPSLTNHNGNSTTCQLNSNYVVVDSVGDYPHNGANSLYSIISETSTAGIMPSRSTSSASAINSSLSSNAKAPNQCNDQSNFMQSSRDYEYISNARKLNPNEYTFNNRLGFVSINQSINNDVTVAVAYQYTHNGKTYQVGEFSDQFTTGPLYLKLLRSGSVVNPKFSTWDLMMKNVYSLGAYNLTQADFKCDVIIIILKPELIFPIFLLEV